jgi:hypothetical protein
MADYFRALLVSKDGDQQSIVVTELAETDLMDGDVTVALNGELQGWPRYIGQARRPSSANSP